MKQVIGNRHSDAQDHAIGVAFEHWLHVSLRLAVKGLIEVRDRLLVKADPRSKRVLIIILKNASSGVNSAVNPSHESEISNIESSNYVYSKGLWLVIFAPIVDEMDDE
jgi:hypothetical protein